MELVGSKFFRTTCHPLTNRQMEVINQSLTILVRDMVSKSLRDWNTKLT